MTKEGRLEGMNLQTLIEAAEIASKDAGSHVREVYRSAQITSTAKADKSPVTEADKKSHAVILQHLSETGLPVLSEEESSACYGEHFSGDYFWLVDPLDGTKEFIHHIDEFTINIALVYQGRPVAGIIYLPLHDRLYAGSGETGVFKKENDKKVLIQQLPERKRFAGLLQQEHIRIIVSRSHVSAETSRFIEQFRNPTIMHMGSSMKFMMLLENRADIYPRLGRTMGWDTAAGHALLNATNRGLYHVDLRSELTYTQPDLTNPPFIAF